MGQLYSTLKSFQHEADKGTWGSSGVAGLRPLLCWASREDIESRALATSPPAASSIAFRAAGEYAGNCCSRMASPASVTASAP